jgi:hypothetical protein
MTTLTLVFALQWNRAAMQTLEERLREGETADYLIDNLLSFLQLLSTILYTSSLPRCPLLWISSVSLAQLELVSGFIAALSLSAPLLSFLHSVRNPSEESICCISQSQWHPGRY